MQFSGTRLQFAVSMALLILVCAGSPLSQAAQWHVGSNGLDSNGCGPNDPCRSISEAIRRASAGDVIFVSPGLYGDLNRNGVLGEPGEESGEIGYGCNCVIKVDKAVIIRSTQGALLTKIDVQSFADLGVNSVYGVRITADNVSFGLPEEGFQISGSNFYALRVDSSHVRVSGDIASGTGSGFLIAGSNNELDADAAINGSGAGFEFDGSNNSVNKCVASGNGSGFLVSINGLLIPATGITFTNDIAVGNGAGFNIFGTANLTSDSAIDNWEVGVVLRAGAAATISNSNVFGNATLQPLNCGLQNFSGAATVVSKTYWGAATGPGADPADAICDYNGSTTTTSSLQTATYPITFTP